MSKVAVPVLQTGQSQVDEFAQSAKENIDWITGQHANAPKVKELPSTATLADLIAAYNKLVGRLER